MSFSTLIAFKFLILPRKLLTNWVVFFGDLFFQELSSYIALHKNLFTKQSYCCACRHSSQPAFCLTVQIRVRVHDETKWKDFNKNLAQIIKLRKKSGEVKCSPGWSPNNHTRTVTKIQIDTVWMSTYLIEPIKIVRHALQKNFENQSADWPWWRNSFIKGTKFSLNFRSITQLI